MPWHLYIVRCRKGELYTGVTANLVVRIDWGHEVR